MPALNTFREPLECNSLLKFIIGGAMEKAIKMYRDNVVFNSLASNSLQCLITKHLSCQDVLSAAMLAVLFYERDIRTAENQGTHPTASNSAMVKCPHFENERRCPIQFNAICGLYPCLVQRAHHQ